MTMRRRLRLVETAPTPTPIDAITIRVAFASSDMKHVDQHFGAAEAFAVYTVTPTSAGFHELVQFGTLAMDGNEDKLDAKIEVLDGCLAVYCQAIGASAINRLKAKGIQALKVSPGAPIKELIAELCQDLREGRSVWLTRAMAQRSATTPGRFDAMEQEGWVE